MRFFKLTKTAIASATVFVASTGIASAQYSSRGFWSWFSDRYGGGGGSHGGASNQVPEIDASAGLLAMAAVMAAVALSST